MSLKKTDIKDEAQYRVHLKERAEALGQTFYPGHEVYLRGDVLKTVWASVGEAEPVQDAAGHAEQV